MHTATRPVLFASDIHLAASDMQTATQFFDWLATEGARAQAVYLLGDVFEVWVGDDDDPPMARRLETVARTLAAVDCRIFLMHGNRDFLLTDQYAARCGITLLPDPFLLDTPELCVWAGGPLLLSHGDLLCTDDQAYQRYRRWVHTRWVQAIFLRLPLRLRRAFVARLQNTTQAERQRKPQAIMDVSEASVHDLLAGHPGSILIHGHTHRPACHEYPALYTRRWVLPDWQQNRGGWLRLDAQGLRAEFLASC